MSPVYELSLALEGGLGENEADFRLDRCLNAGTLGGELRFVLLRSPRNLHSFTAFWVVSHRSIYWSEQTSELLLPFSQLINSRLKKTNEKESSSRPSRLVPLTPLSSSLPQVLELDSCS